MFFANLSLSFCSDCLCSTLSISLSLSIFAPTAPSRHCFTLMSHSRRLARGQSGRGVACMTAIDMWLNEHPRLSRWFVFGSILGSILWAQGVQPRGGGSLGETRVAAQGKCQQQGHQSTSCPLEHSEWQSTIFQVLLRHDLQQTQSSEIISERFGNDWSEYLTAQRWIRNHKYV